MDAILVVNAGSSSLKFQIFAVDGATGLERRQVRGPDRRHRRAAALRPDGTGGVLVDRPGAPRRSRRRPRHARVAWLAYRLAGPQVARSATASCMAGRTTPPGA
jgi:hypothetical protein